MQIAYFPKCFFFFFWFNGPLSQYFSLYRADSKKEAERREMIDEIKNSKLHVSPPEVTASAEGPCLIQIN